MAGNGAGRLLTEVDIQVAAMSLIWNDPTGDGFVPWLEEVRAAGYEGITCFANKLPHLDRPSVLRRLLDEQGLRLAALDLRMHDDFDAYRKLFESMQALECGLFVCIDPSGTEKDYAKYGDLLNRIGELSLEYGIHTHYHNHTAAVGETYTDMEKLMDELDFAKVSLMLDIGHATKDFVELPPADRAFRFLEKYWDRIHYLELKDWNETTDLNTPLGEGHADYSRIFDLIRLRGYSGWVTVEQNGNDGMSLGRSPFECASISRRFLQANLGV